MILAGGKVYESGRQEEILSQMEDQINWTRETKQLTTETVVEALVKLGQRIGAQWMNIPDTADVFGGTYALGYASILSPRLIEARLDRELGKDRPYRIRECSEDASETASGAASVASLVLPMGTLFHVGAGNADFLPAYSVAEGLLTGNVNILKLPGEDHGMSLELLRLLVETEPKLADFIYVFDTASRDQAAMKQMIRMADAAVVWGGDAAVEAVRGLAPPGTRLIEWGHRLGFAYISGYTDRERELSALAEHIITTKQLLCSSCQTIFIDTEQLDELMIFGREFLAYLERAAGEHSGPGNAVMGAVTLQRYCDELEEIVYGDGDKGHEKQRTLRGRGCSLTICNDMELELSGMFGNCLVKRLPRQQLFPCLRRQKGRLQTAGLICSPDRREELTRLLAGCGVTRITGPGSMSAVFPEGAHDGEYPLRRYIRIVDIEGVGNRQNG